MKRSYALHKSFKMKSGEQVYIKYWADETTVYVAGFNEKDIKVTVGTYTAVIDEVKDPFYERTRKSLIQGLGELVESDLINQPDLHYRPATLTQ